MKVPGSVKISLAQELGHLASLCGPTGLPLEKVFEELGHRSHALVALVLSIPFIFPIPLPGLSTPFGIVVIFLGLAILLDKDPMLPKRFKKMEVPRAVLIATTEKLNWILGKFERLIRPRWLAISAHPVGIRVQGLLILIAAVLLALPAPPGGNVLPALSIILFSLSLIEEDGVVGVLGILVLSVATAMMFGLWFGAWELVKNFS